MDNKNYFLFYDFFSLDLKVKQKTEIWKNAINKLYLSKTHCLKILLFECAPYGNEGGGYLCSWREKKIRYSWCVSFWCLYGLASHCFTFCKFFIIFSALFD